MSNLEIILLNSSEVCLLLSRISNETMDFQATDADGQAVPLLLRLFLVFNELVQPDNINSGELAIAVTEQDAWILRKSVKQDDIDIQGNPIGLLLLRKIHQALLNYRLPKLNQLDRILEITTEDNLERWCNQWLMHQPKLQLELPLEHLSL